MRKRSTEILEKLILSNSKSMEVKKLITTYRISLKTLRTDVNEINDFLHQEITFKGIANFFKGNK